MCSTGPVTSNHRKAHPADTHSHRPTLRKYVVKGWLAGLLNGRRRDSKQAVGLQGWKVAGPEQDYFKVRSAAPPA